MFLQSVQGFDSVGRGGSKLKKKLGNTEHRATGAINGVARICCEEGQRWKLCHGALTVDFRAGVQQLLDD